MNRFKEDILQELQDVRLTDEKKHAIAQKARRKGMPRRSDQWQYRIVLATFTLCAIAFSYLFSQDEENKTGVHQGAMVQQKTDASSFWTFLESDLVSGLLLVGITACLTLIIKYTLKKKNYGLPVCIECGETWSHKQAHKFHWKNGEIECPHCGKKQYRTKKSVQLGALLNIPISLMVFMHFLFDNFFIGFIFYFLSIIIFYHQLVPYLFDLQEDDPMNEPLW
ncbi:TIGR04104 family putative zinc finger protein [Lysinibacillus sp. NPDC096418]|uniref:TIGR04104 family putative zinc finger protein n=1 Tax=Lysinibacillus sp. NPDC096418 TaxID=3364138 RepID=UPI0038038975